MQVLVTGAAGAVGRRLCRQLVDRPDTSVIGLDQADVAPVPGMEFKQVDLLTADLRRWTESVDVVVHLATTLRADGTIDHDGRLDLGIARRVLDAASRADVGQVVVISTAMVYGAWEENAVPLTEDAPVRPVPDFGFAVQKANLEELARDWRADQPDGVLTVLRPAVTVADEQPGGLARILHAAMTIRSQEGDPPAQFLHADDLAAAILTAIDNRYDGILNVAPDRWIPADDLAALEGPKPRLRMPGWMARVVNDIRFRLGVSPTPAAIVPYTTYPWVVANDRLKALGWEETSSNEEAYVAGHEPGRLDMMTARRRQELALGGSVLVVASAIGVGVWLYRRSRR